ncbi:MAG TPA: efflux RND transporter periplasmic adaptor subunit [Gemmataceae bacterium]|jgi:multidrug efflux system membrane fusion protein|nr:efflux RND transporter periplasmic adaptor subunit [Gemmataceae bacterium]
MNCRLRSSLLGCCLTLSGAGMGCSHGPPQVAPPQAPVVPVSQAVQREVTDYVDFTGRTDAVNTVNIVPRVTGYLVKMPFKEGSLVKKDDLLFEVDPRPYQAQLDQANGQVKLYEAQLKLAKVILDRDLEIAKTPGAISLQLLDKDRASVEEAEASVKAAQASLEVFKLNLSFCRVTSPIDGMVARYFFTLGNLVNQDQTLLTTVLSLDPMYAYFDMDEPTLVQIRQAIGAGKIKPYDKGNMAVFMGLQGEEGFPHEGTINFINNQVNPATGSIAVRGVFHNRVLQEDTRILSPGMFVRIHLPIGEPHPALLIIDRAVGSDQGLKYIYVVGAQNKAEYRRVTTGALQPDGLRVITDGLKAGEWVAVGALQQIRPNMAVQAEKTTMPSFSQPAAGKK